MTDITHDNIFTADVATRLRRTIDEGPALPERAADHELAPQLPPPEKTGLEQIAEKAITPIRQTGQRLLDQFPPLHDQLNRAEQMVITAMADAEAGIYGWVGMIDAAAKIRQHVEQQLKEAMEPLAALTNGK